MKTYVVSLIHPIIIVSYLIKMRQKKIKSVWLQTASAMVYVDFEMMTSEPQIIHYA